MLEDQADSLDDLRSILQANPQHPDRVALFKRLEGLEVALGLRKPGQFSDDPLIEEWEQALEDGRALEGLNDNVHPLIKSRRRQQVAQPLPVRR